MRVTEINEVYRQPDVLQRNPFLADSLLIGANGERVISKITPSYVYNTVDQPIFPKTGKRFSASIDLAGIGGNTNYYKPMIEGVVVPRSTPPGSRSACAGRPSSFTRYRVASCRSSRSSSSAANTASEASTSARLARRTRTTGLVLGGDKSLLFNIEEQITIAGPVRAILFYDAGQVQPGPTIQNRLFVPLGEFNSLHVPGRNFRFSDFKTSTGLEIRFFMPVLNVPFRLILRQPAARGRARQHAVPPEGLPVPVRGRVDFLRTDRSSVKSRASDLRKDSV